MMKRMINAAIVVLFFVTAALAQDSIAAKVDAFVKSEMQKQQIPGMAVGVMRNGKIIFEKGYGFANLEHQVPVTPLTIFQSGSMGKQFTATAIMMLVEEGKLSLDDSITKHLPGSPPTWEKITVRHLLTHTGGMTDYPSDFDFRRDYTEQEMLERIKLVPLAFPAGEKWSYSNLGYVTLGILINKVSGQFYGDFLRDRVFKPLRMETARVISEEDIVLHRAAGYRFARGQVKNQSWVAPSLNTTADGALYLNLHDMEKWDAALYTEKLLKRSSFDQMWTPVKLNNGTTVPYGFGWRVGTVKGHRVIEHGGSWQGFKSQISRYVDDKLTIVVFANSSRADQSKLANGIAEIYGVR